MFDKVNVHTYKRNDYETANTRVGFISQEIEEALAPEFQNIVGSYAKEEEGKEPTTLKTLDYSRLVCVLWGGCKKQQQQFADLTTRISALEAKRATNAAK